MVLPSSLFRSIPLWISSLDTSFFRFMDLRQSHSDAISLHFNVNNVCWYVLLVFLKGTEEGCWKSFGEEEAGKSIVCFPLPWCEFVVSVLHCFGLTQNPIFCRRRWWTRYLRSVRSSLESVGHCRRRGISHGSSNGRKLFKFRGRRGFSNRGSRFHQLWISSPRPLTRILVIKSNICDRH